MMRTVTVSEAKAQFSALLEAVLAGEEIAVGRRGQPEVVLRRYRAADGERRRLGTYDGPYRFDRAEFDAADADVAAAFGVEDGDT